MAVDLGRTVTLAQAALGHAGAGDAVALADPRDLGGSDRSVVLRCTWGDRDVVVKHYLPGEDAAQEQDARSRFVREVAGLRSFASAPDLLAVDDDAHLLVMSDLGTWPTLADLLLGADRDAAWEGAVSWARALGELLGASRERLPAFAETVARVDTGPDWDAVGAVRDGLGKIAALLGEEPGAQDEIAQMAPLFERSDMDVVSPTDTCPDNALLTPDGWRFLDLEGATVHHSAIDAAYMLLPFASCWCVYEPPAVLTATLLETFTAELARFVPEVDGPVWRREVDLACGAWILASTTWLLDGAVADRPRVGPEGRSPSFRQLVAQRWRWGAANLATTLPDVAALLRRASGWAVAEWGSTIDLPGYPAFTEESA